jgi:uncharacterized alkaline shock family protein YloU
MEEYSIKGKTTIDPDVLTTIARLATLDVPGVSHMYSGIYSVDSILKRHYDNGIKLAIENDTVFLDLYVVLKSDSNFRKTGKLIQKKVARAVSEMVGMEIGHINIHIEDIDYSSAAS